MGDETRILAKDAHAERVERPHHEAFGGFVTDQLVDAIPHLARGLVGEGHGEDVLGPDALFLDQVGNSMGQHARLAGAGSGDDKHRPFGCHNRALLVLIQSVEQWRNVIRHLQVRSIHC